MIILNGQYDITDLNEGVTLSESIDGIAYTANIRLASTGELEKLRPDVMNTIEVIEPNFETKKDETIFSGIVWDIIDSRQKRGMYTLVGKERTIYLEESEDEYLLPAGQTATQRIKRYCNDWGIPIGSIANTGTALSKAVYRQQPILDMMLSDIKETAQKGGRLYKLRMQGKLDLVEIGSNKTIWELQSVTEEKSKKRTMSGAVTQVKVLGKAEDDKRSPIIGIYKKDTDKYGTLQKIVSDDKVKSASQGKAKARSMFMGASETVNIRGIDINTIRAGDKVILDGTILYVIDITHELGRPGKMSLSLGSLDHIKRRFYSEGNL